MKLEELTKLGIPEEAAKAGHSHERSGNIRGDEKTYRQGRGADYGGGQDQRADRDGQKV